jgi:23S rRNA pseudouridine1911/1915/1917 synthase
VASWCETRIGWFWPIVCSLQSDVMLPPLPERLPVLDVLYEDNHCLAVVKPAGVLTMGDATGDRALDDLAKAYLAQKYAKPGAVFLGIVQRLDRPVSGVVLFARTSKAAARLAEQFRTRVVEKCYRAVVSGIVPEPRGVLHDWLVKDEATNCSRRTAPNATGSRECRLSYQRLGSAHGRTLLEIHPETGRSHQIRVQLAGAGWPIVGDTKYGSREPFAEGAIALHALSLHFHHPTRGERIAVTAPYPAGWNPYRHLELPDGHHPLHTQ